MKKKRIVAIGILSLFLILTLGSEIQAISWCDGRINVKGSIRHQSVFRADDLQKDFEHIQARTTMRLETLIDIYRSSGKQPVNQRSYKKCDQKIKRICEKKQD